MRIRLSSFLFVVAGLVTASATADGANFEISTPTAGIQLQTGQKTTLEWDNWKLHKDHAVKRQGTGARRLKYQRDDHRNLEGFITACRTDCESGVADGTKGSCGGFVVNYSSGSSRKTPRYCVFKTEGASPYSRKSKDFHEYRLNLNKNISIELVRVNDRGVQEESYSIKSEDCQQNFGNCTWQVPDNASEGNYQISVRNTGTPVGTVLKSAEFSIVKTKPGEDSKTNQSTQNQDKPVEYSGGPGRVLIPKRSQQWHAGSTVQIEWNFKKYSGPVDIYLSQEYRDSGVEAKKNWIVLKKHGVKGQGTGAKRFNFRESRDGDLEGFITACKKRCESGRANGKNGSCGGFVVNYSPGSEKKKPQHCVFKLAGVRPYKKNTKDFYVWIAPKRIAESVANTGHYRWTIHQNTPAGTRQRISVVPTKGDLAGIQSDEFALKKWVKSERLRGQVRHYFSSDRSKVLLPTPMSVFPETKPIRLLWEDQSQWLHDRVTIELREHGGSRAALENWKQENSGSFEWDLSKAGERTLTQCRLSPGCFFQIESANRAGRVISSGFFRLGDPGIGQRYSSITARNPNAQDDDATESEATLSDARNLTTPQNKKPQTESSKITLGDPVEVSWTDKTTEPHPVRLTLSRDKQPLLIIASGIVSQPGDGNTATLDTLPHTVMPGDGYVINVRALDNGALRGRSEPFAIAGTTDTKLVITEPSEKTVWDMASESHLQKISWTRPPKTTVRLDLYKAGHRIKTVIDKTRRVNLNWRVIRTLPTDNNYRLRLQALNPDDPGDSSVFAYSEPFCIQRTGESCEVTVEQAPVQPTLIQEGPSAEEVLLSQWCTDQNIQPADCQDQLSQQCQEHQLTDETCTPAEVERVKAEAAAQPVLLEDEAPAVTPVVEAARVVDTTVCTWAEEPSSPTVSLVSGNRVLQVRGPEQKNSEFELYLTDVFTRGKNKFVEQLTPNKSWERDSFNLYQAFEADHRLQHRPIMPGSLTLLAVPVTPGKAATEAVPHRDQSDGRLLSTRDGSKSGEIDHEDGSITRIPYPDRRVHWIARYASTPVSDEEYMQAVEKIGRPTENNIFVLPNSPVLPGSVELLTLFTSERTSLPTEGSPAGEVQQISDTGNGSLTGVEGNVVGTVDYVTGEISFNPVLRDGAAVFATYLSQNIGETLTMDGTDQRTTAEPVSTTSATGLTSDTTDDRTAPERGRFSFSGNNAIAGTPIVPGSVRIKAGELLLSDSHAKPGTLAAFKNGVILENSGGTVDYGTGKVVLDLSVDVTETTEFTASYYTQLPHGQGTIDNQTGEVTVNRLAGMPDNPVCSDFILTTIAQQEGLATLLAAFTDGSAAPSTYEAAGIEGVTESNLVAVNAAIAAASPAPTTVVEIQAIIDSVNATIQKTLLTAAKYLRNVSRPNKNPATADITYNGVDYFVQGVRARRKDTLEYLVVVTNGRDADATGLVFNDNLPDSTTYITGSAAVDTDGDERFDVTTGTGGESEGPDDGIVVMSGNQITVYIGAGGSDAAGSAYGGTITGIASAPNNKSAVLYRFTPKQLEHRPAKARGSIVVGKAYGKPAHGYRVTALSIDPAAPPGTYTFLASSGNSGLVELKRDGEVVETLPYDWQAKVGDGKTYTFAFAGYLSLTVTKRGAGTMNLYAMPQSLFNDRQTVVVQ